MNNKFAHTEARAAFFLKNNLLVFGMLWCISALIYIPTAKAGWVVDAIGWINDMKTLSFWDFINRKESGSESFYQLFAIHYYVCYKLWGMNVWMWSLFYMTVHAVNVTLLFILLRSLLTDSGLVKKIPVALCGVLLYIVCPHISEVIVWKACFHYIMGFSFILFSLIMVQKYQHQQRNLYVGWALSVFCLSAFGLEIFYLTPFLGLALALYYRFVLHYDKIVFRKTVSRFFLWQMFLFVLYLIGLYFAYKFIRPHGTDVSSPIIGYLSKPPKYIFHIVFLGRFFTDQVRRHVYDFFNVGMGKIIFYILISVVILYLSFSYRKMKTSGKLLIFLFICVIFSIGIVLPLWFPEDGIVAYDRYTYVSAAFISVFLALFVDNLFGRKVFVVFVLIYGGLNLFFSLKVNSYWRQSGHIVNNLLKTFPNDPSKTVLLLNMPDCMKGVKMLVARDDEGFKTMRNIMLPNKISNPVYDVEAYYSQNPTDGAHINILNDSTVKVTLNEWGNWWMYYGFGAVSYENKDFKVNMIDAGHMYELTVKHPFSEYLLLYQVGDHWKTADTQQKNVDQF